MKKVLVVVLIVVIVLLAGAYAAWRFFGPMVLLQFFRGGGFSAPSVSNPLEKLPDVNPAAKTNPFEGVRTNPFE